MDIRCVIIGSSPETDVSEIKNLLQKDDYIICADGGRIFAGIIGVSPDLIVGDFDSSDSPADNDCEIIRLPVSKDDTDTLYAVREGLKRGFREFLLCGVSGGRADHTYANFCILEFIRQQGADGMIADSGTVVRIIGCGEHIISGRKGTGFGIFPFGCSECTLSLEGFDYPLDHGTLGISFPMGVSNRISDDNAKITIFSGSAIMFLYEK